MRFINLVFFFNQRHMSRTDNDDLMDKNELSQVEGPTEDAEKEMEEDEELRK